MFMSKLFKDQMVSIKVLNFNEDNIDVLHRLWKRHLCKDDTWHFFWEGKYSVIRCHKAFSSKVKTFLKYHKVNFKDQGVWIDNIDTTKRYQKEFQQIFHGYSEIAMKAINADRSEMQNLIDRVIHCFINNMTTEERRRDDGIYFEPWLIAEQAIARAIFIGQLVGRNRL